MQLPDQKYEKKPTPEIDLRVVTGEIPPPTANPPEDIYEQKFKSSILDQAKEYPLPQAIVNFVCKGIYTPLFTAKSYSLHQGKQKSKKTTGLALMIADYIRLTPSEDETRFECALPGSVLFIDTEQGESYAARTMRLILKMAGLNSSENLVYCDLREHPAADRRKIIEAGIRLTPNLKMVVIDGIVDLMTDFMDPAEGHMTITALVSLCSQYDIHIAGVLHQNKGDKNARAHVGTISSQKCEMEIMTEIDPDDRSQSIVTCVNSRGLPFEPFAIRWDKGSLPRINQEWNSGARQEGKTVKKVEAARAIAETVFKPLAAVSSADAIESIMKITTKSKSTAKRYLEDLEGWGMVKQGPDKKYRLNMDGKNAGK
ncbi:MAG TPA: AAA family ATPase [Puia sp.]|jgi:hypothetical protein|nr:AAA family ATPase [Puia sp.]